MAVQLTGLMPEFQEKIAEVLKTCAEQGAIMVPSQTVRSPQDQARLWRRSRSTEQINAALTALRSAGALYLAEVLAGVGPQEGSHVTNALPGNSWHQWGEAVDCYWHVDGAVEESATRKVNGVNGYQLYAGTAKALGLDAGLFWKSIKDTPHVQFRDAASPQASGLSWPQIDQEMQERFGPRLTLAPVAAHKSASDSLRLSYEAPEGWRVYETLDTPAAVYVSKMSVCADGAPTAYHADNARALDYLANAGRPGSWYGICTNPATGEPLVQGKDDPAPGYYISPTALTNAGVRDRTPARYIDATVIPYIVLPAGRSKDFTSVRPVRLGDVGLAYNITTGALCFAQCCEIGPARELGEGSVAMAKALGINPSAKGGGVSTRSILTVVFPGSGRGSGMSVEEINAKTQPLFDAWGGVARLRAYETL